MPEETLDNSTRDAILRQVLSRNKPQPQQSQENASKVALNTNKGVSISTSKPICENCGHKVWNDGEIWQHSGKDHDKNCECREIKVYNDNVSSTPTKESSISTTSSSFTSSTSSEQLLEACLNKRQELQEKETKLSDDLRKAVIEKVNSRADSLLKGWRF